jgi:hypothetical protein
VKCRPEQHDGKEKEILFLTSVKGGGGIKP